MRTSFFLLAMLASLGSAFGQSMPLSLDQAIEYAQTHNAQVRVQSLERKVAEKVLIQNITNLDCFQHFHSFEGILVSIPVNFI